MPPPRLAAPRASRLGVLFGVLAGLTVAGLPFLSKTVWRREQEVARMRDESYEIRDGAGALAAAKDDARNSRLSRRKG
jgi:hypothetical protein